MTKRVLIAGFKHETNTFSKTPTTIQSYQARSVTEGPGISAYFKGTKTEVAAFLDACERYGWETVLSVVADATPSGRLTKDTYEHFAGRIVDDVRKAGKLDAILLNLHGAMAAEHTHDGEGTLMQRLREVVGPGVVIMATLDLHANVTKAMATYADILVSYRTYPHIDHYEIATEAMDIVKRTLDGAIKPKIYIARRPMIDGADHGRTTTPGPMTELLARCTKIKAEDKGVLAASINAGFAWADIPEVGPTAVIVGDGNDPRFQGYVESLADYIWETRDFRTVKYFTVADAIARAKAVASPGKPAVLSDAADNPGGGGYCESTGLLRGMIDAGLENAAMAAFYDPEAAAVCHKAGVGAKIKLKLGGNFDIRFSEPIIAEGTVTHLGDGKFNIEGPMLKGLGVDMGPTATFKIGGVEVVINSRRFQNYDRNFFRTGGVEPTKLTFLAVKSSQHFRAAYAPLASEVIIVDEGGGVMSNDLTKLPFENVPRPIYPLD